MLFFCMLWLQMWHWVLIKGHMLQAIASSRFPAYLVERDFWHLIISLFWKKRKRNSFCCCSLDDITFIGVEPSPSSWHDITILRLALFEVSEHHCHIQSITQCINQTSFSDKSHYNIQYDVASWGYMKDYVWLLMITKVMMIPLPP